MATSENERLKVLVMSAEVVPFAKTGGLADVAGSLPVAVRELGHDVRTIMPRYGRIGIDKFGLTKRLESFDVPMDSATEPATLYEGKIGRDVPVYFVDSARYFDRDGIYMYPDDAERFIFFSRAALEMLPHLGWTPDIIHLNDWHTAIVANWLKTTYAQKPPYEGIATLYTIHNLAYQGIFGHRVLEVAGLDEYGFIAHPDVAPSINEVVSMMARGILFADIINTVSETYAKEILTKEMGEGLDPILRDRRDRLFGILNGIDTDTLNPATDPHIAANFDMHSLEKRLQNKAALQREAGLVERPDAPLVGIISRLADQKGFDLIAEIMDPMLRLLDVQFVLLGTGDQKYHEMFQAIANRYPGQAGIFLTFNTPLAQRIYAGSDMFLMPSRFEPCGLGQMLAMRYGSIPVVRSTGGLADTVPDFNPLTGQGSGFAFKPYDHMALYTALVRAVETYKHRDIWRQLQLRGMGTDFSWAASASKYVDLYHRALASRHDVHRLEDYDFTRNRPFA